MTRSTNVNRRLSVVFFVLVLVFIVLSGQASDGEKLHSDFGTATEVALLVRLQYVDPVKISDLMSAYMATDTVEGMLESLGDHYTRYMDPEAYKAYSEDVEGTYSGLGIHVGLRDGRTTVIAPMPDTPAKRAGLASGDVIMAIDGKSTENMSLEEAVSLMKGPEGTRVVLTIKRGDEEIRDVEIVRARIVVPVVEYEMIDESIGYLGIVTFSADTADQTHRALEELRSQGAIGLVLDLRWNGGGLFDQSVLVASMFIEEGPIVHRVGRDGIRNTHMRSSDIPVCDMPLVVLVNEWSASSSEILAGALKDSGRAHLVGTKTFGKGVVQGVFPLSNGGALSVTTDRYLTAAGHSINDKGIMPDYVVELPQLPVPNTSDQSTPDGEVSTDETTDPVGEETSPTDSRDEPEATGDSVDAAEGELIEDTQLLKALDVLRALLAEQNLQAAS